MKFTKVIREFAEKTVCDKLSKVNKEARADYDNRRTACLEELRVARDAFSAQVEEIVSKHGFDTTVVKWGSEMSVGKAYCGGDEAMIRISEELKAIQKAEHERRNKMDEALKNLELECALGADKKAFMEMLEAITF